ncbi:SRPBCC domain-containing protein [Sphingomonas sp. 35-24ZXX]|uniref:SRPBCC domain-containing protein n=1 Tax=Sphingomonas sp. 35-24ZXX TaxID=1545915 RepID=UPI000AB4408B
MTEAQDQPGFPLQVTRHIAAPTDRVWQVMTERLEEYWCPRPWRTEIIEIDWRSGGRMATIMRGPDG